jgi:methionyl-tRNA formyltransferase
MSPWPGAFTALRGRTVRVEGARVVQPQGSSAPPGTAVLVDKSRVLVACGQGIVELAKVKPEGKRAMTGAEWAQGRGIIEGDVLGK